MIKGMRVLAVWCLWQALFGALIAPGGATAAAPAQDNRGPRRLLGTAQTIAALDARPEARDVIERYGFSWLTDEGTMMMPTFLPARDTYNFEPGDRLAAYAREHDLQLVGHTLIDPHTSQGWVAQGYANGTISKGEARDIFREYITTVVSHYCGVVAAWHVVNEPFADSGSDPFRTNSRTAPDQNMFWYEVFDGPSYINEALGLARRACPQTKLYLNDYGIEWLHGTDNPKATRIIPVLRDLKALGLLDGIGFEGHFHKSIGIGDVKAAMDAYTGLGLDVAFTELDLRMIHGYPNPNPANTGVSATLSPADAAEQARIYGALARLCQENPRCTRFSVWGIDDNSSWINAYFGPDAPLLFRYDERRQLVPKPAYFAVADALGLSVLPAPGQPAERPNCGTRFPETGKCLGGRFAEYWQAHGGLAVNGLPLTDEFTEILEDGRPYTVQYFERVRLEYHPEAADPRYQVLLGQFGRLLHPADPPVPAVPGMTYFDATGHNVPPDFLAYWEANGGLAQFGFPLSEVFRETLEDGKEYEVQYFERARFERHPENAAPYNVLLGQFGRRILERR
jgi:endo-1,4-beta-xylanase